MLRCLLIIATVFIANVQAKDHLVLTTWCDPPFSTKQQNGYFDLMLLEAFARLGKSISIEIKPAERSLADANNGITDGDFIRVSQIGSLYPNLLKVPEPLYHMEFVAFSKIPDLALPQGWQSLSAYSIGYINGWKILEENTFDLTDKVAISDQELLFQLLNANRIEVALYSKDFGLNTINRLGLKGIHITSTPLAIEPMYLFLNKRHQTLIPELARILKEIKMKHMTWYEFK